MAEEATAPAVTETPATPVDGAPATTPANDTTPAATPANDNAQPTPPTEAEVLALVERYGSDKALDIIARKSGYKLDGQTVSVKERADFREWQRQAKKTLEDRERAISDQLGSKAKELEAEIQLGKALREAHARGDYDGVAKALGVENWEALQGDFIKRLADPNHQRLMDLEKREREREEGAQKQRELYEQQQRQAQHEAIVRNDKIRISGAMKESENRMARELSDLPDVVNMVHAVLLHHQDPATGRTISLDDAMNKPLPGGSVAISVILRQWHERLAKAFAAGEAAPTLQASAAATEAAKPKGKTEPAPKVAPSAARTFADTREWTQSATERLKKAFEEDAQKEAESRRKPNSGAPA